MRALTDMRYPAGREPAPRAEAVAPRREPHYWPRNGPHRMFAVAVLGLGLLAGCAYLQPIEAQRQPVATCSESRIAGAQQLFLVARSNLVRHFKERGLTTLNASFSLAGDAIQMARSTRYCPEFDTQARTAAIGIVRMSRQLRGIAYATMRDPDMQAAITLMGDQYADAFAGRDLD